MLCRVVQRKEINWTRPGLAVLHSSRVRFFAFWILFPGTCTAACITPVCQRRTAGHVCNRNVLSLSCLCERSAKISLVVSVAQRSSCYWGFGHVELIGRMPLLQFTTNYHSLPQNEPVTLPIQGALLALMAGHRAPQEQVAVGQGAACWSPPQHVNLL